LALEVEGKLRRNETERQDRHLAGSIKDIFSLQDAESGGLEANNCHREAIDSQQQIRILSDWPQISLESAITRHLSDRTLKP